VFEGQLSVVDPNVDPVTRTVHLLARVPNPGGLLKPGLSADVSVTLAERRGSLTIPDESVFAEGSNNFVFIVKPDSSVARVPVQLGSRDSSRVEVLRGLTAGQIVVRTGHQKLFDGAHVIPVSDIAALAGPGGAGAPEAAPAARDSAATAKATPKTSSKTTAKGAAKAGGGKTGGR
jgi:multidrug efflux pump subunit AcrA (membrane-fusion protein)